jgi:hypothetical protein
MEVKLLDDGYFILTLKDGRNFKGRFCMNSLEKFSEAIGITNVFQLLLNFTTGMTIKNYAHFILTALQYTYRKNPDQFKETIEDVLEWIDDMGGLRGDQFLSLFRYGITTHVPPKPKTQEELDEEKKNLTSLLDGGTSNDFAARQE